ncbi:uncharacterized protein BDV17DRAFT_256876 [Aspergillus undulatus]|uniref:uncharacterized protein n=1 Tax=Aspergillus undulatus TaxID=1810928 RepID=UPI003CCD3DCC
MAWAEIVLLLVLEENDVPNPDVVRERIMRRELWTDRHIRGSPRSFLSFMRPGCEIPELPARIKEAMVLFMPYIHWETQEKQNILESFSLCKFIADMGPRMVRGFLSQLAAEQPSPELHQSSNTYTSERWKTVKEAIDMYTTLANNQRANWDDIQDPVWRRGVLAKCMMSANDVDLQLLDAYASNELSSHPLHPRRTLDQYFYYTLDHTTRRNQDQVVARHGRKLGKKQPIVLMVDQLWLWRLDNVIVSCFPQRRECGLDDPDRFDRTDVFENIITSLKADPIGTSEREGPMKLVLRIVRECSNTCFDPMKNLDDDFKVLDIFNNSINCIADDEVNCYERFVGTLNKPGHHDQLNTEFHLLREIKDIQEELGMMRQVFEEQKGVLSSMAEKVPLSPVGDAHAAVLDEGARYLGKISTMENQARRTNDSINSLMDLRQRHASLSEAQATGRQGNTIMVFTVVTILFLPASFMASFFALPVAQFPRAQGDPDNMDLAYIVRWLLVFTVPVAAFFIFIALYINEVLSAFSRKVSSVHKIIVMVPELLAMMKLEIQSLPIRLRSMLDCLVFVMRRAGAADSDADEEEAEPSMRHKKRDVFWRRVKSGYKR